jgi:hypothetical protein
VLLLGLTPAAAGSLLPEVATASKASALLLLLIVAAGRAVSAPLPQLPVPTETPCRDARWLIATAAAAALSARDGGSETAAAAAGSSAAPAGLLEQDTVVAPLLIR